MNLKKMTVMFVIIVSSLAPVSLNAQMSIPPGVPDAITEEEVRQFVNKYIDRYKAMDLDLFMELYSKKGVENRMLPYADIKAFYRKTFAQSNQFLYHLNVYSVQTHAKSAFVTGRYKMIQTLKKGNKMKIFHGNIQWDLIREDGSLRIREVNYGRNRGDD